MTTSSADIAVAVQSLYCWATVASALSMAPMFPLLEVEWDLSQTQLNLITGSCVLALGYANFIVVPLSNILGRRFTSLTLGLLVMGSCIWEARAQSYSSLIGARVVNGVATATSETIMVQVICDLFFLHERGVWMGVYLYVWFLLLVKSRHFPALRLTDVPHAAARISLASSLGRSSPLRLRLGKLVPHLFLLLFFFERP